MRVLLIEDDAALGDGLRSALTLEGFQVDWITDGDDALAVQAAENLDAVILDLRLPGTQGQTILDRWRRQGRNVPVLVLTACDSKKSCLEALNGGADDYLVKPVDLDELIARLRALKRRAGGRATNSLTRGPLALDLTSRSAAFDGAKLDLSTFEFAVLEALAERADQPVSRETLESRLYGWDGGPESNSLEVLIHKLRGKLGRDRIRTIRGTGYRLVS